MADVFGWPRLVSARGDGKPRVMQRRILHIEPDGTISHVDYDDAQPVLLTRSFLADPQRYLPHLSQDDS